MTRATISLDERGYVLAKDEAHALGSFVAEFVRRAIDTSALIAFLDRPESHHALFRRLFSQPPQLVTSALVVAEGHGWFLRRYDVQRGIQFLAFIAAGI